MDISTLEQTALESHTANEIRKLLLTITKEKSKLISQRNDSKGNIDDTFINSQIALLTQLEFIAKDRLPEVSNKNTRYYYLFHSVAKKLLDTDTFKTIESKIN